MSKNHQKEVKMMAKVLHVRLKVMEVIQVKWLLECPVNNSSTIKHHFVCVVSCKISEGPDVKSSWIYKCAVIVSSKQPFVSGDVFWGGFA